MAAKKKNKVKKTDKGRVYVSASFNNTLITITDSEGKVILWGSSGSSGFKGTRKSTPYAATTAVEKVMEKAKQESGLKEVEIYIKGPGPGRDAAIYYKEIDLKFKNNLKNPIKIKGETTQNRLIIKAFSSAPLDKEIEIDVAILQTYKTRGTKDGCLAKVWRRTSKNQEMIKEEIISVDKYDPY